MNEQKEVKTGIRSSIMLEILMSILHVLSNHLHTMLLFGVNVADCVSCQLLLLVQQVCQLQL